MWVLGLNLPRQNACAIVYGPDPCQSVQRNRSKHFSAEASWSCPQAAPWPTCVQVCWEHCSRRPSLPGVCSHREKAIQSSHMDDHKRGQLGTGTKWNRCASGALRRVLPPPGKRVFMENCLTANMVYWFYLACQLLMTGWSCQRTGRRVLRWLRGSAEENTLIH